jgi:hypothetical protein
MLVLLGVSGFTVTLVFDLSTTLSYALFVEYSLKQLLASITMGAVFYLIHLAGNVVIFTTLIPLVLTAVRRGILPVPNASKGPVK